MTLRAGDKGFPSTVEKQAVFWAAGGTQANTFVRLVRSLKIGLYLSSSMRNVYLDQTFQPAKDQIVQRMYTSVYLLSTNRIPGR